VGSFTVKQLDISSVLINESGLSKPSNSTSPIGFGNVADAAVLPHQGVFFSDGDGGINNRVEFLDIKDIKQAAYLQGSLGTSPGLFNSPHSLDYDPVNSLVIVADRGNSRLQFFSVKSGSSFLFISDCSEFAGRIDADGPRSEAREA
jgi:NHL repeat